MKVVYFEKSFTLDSSVVTVGTFDGLHIGHQKVFKVLKNTAQQLQCKSVIITFNPHPRHFLTPERKTILLTTLQEKMLLLKDGSYKPDIIAILPFNKEMAIRGGKDFLENIIYKYFHPKGIVIGYDHHFGKNRKSSIQEVKDFSKNKNILCKIVQAEKLGDDIVSSTSIRHAIHNNQLPWATKSLGYFYSMYGKVVEGDKRGKVLGFPTANLQILEEEYKLFPQNGVYATLVKYKGRVFYSVSNIGLRPTVNKQEKPSIEVYIFDFNEDIYNQEILLFIVEKIREEKKFNLLEDLKNQIQEDCQQALSILKNIQK